MDLQNTKKERLTERMCLRMTKTERKAIQTYAFVSSISEGQALRELISRFLSRGDD